MITKANSQALTKAMKRVAESEVAYAWRGAGDPIDTPAIELERERALAAWQRLLTRLESSPKKGPEDL